MKAVSEDALLPLADSLRQCNKRLVVIMVGQLRSAAASWVDLRRNLLDSCEHILAVQCPAEDASLAGQLYGTNLVDGWDPPKALPGFMRYAWPVFGNSGRLASRTKGSFYSQLLRQLRAAKVFGSCISGESDVVLKWRPDLRLLEPIRIPSGPLGGRLLLPEHDNHAGFNDQCALGSWAVMEPYFRRISGLRRYFQQAGNPHAESYLMWSMAGITIARMPICYVIDRGDHFHPVRASASLGDQLSVDLVERLRLHGVDVSVEAEAIKHWQLNGLASIWQKAVSLVTPPLISLP